MPEMNFCVRWPDGAESLCYSPSRVVADYFESATSYPLPDFLARSRAALLAASDRVRERYGSACGRALAQLGQIEQRAAAFAAHSDPIVLVVSVQGGAGDASVRR